MLESLSTTLLFPFFLSLPNYVTPLLHGGHTRRPLTWALMRPAVRSEHWMRPGRELDSIRLATFIVSPNSVYLHGCKFQMFFAKSVSVSVFVSLSLSLSLSSLALSLSSLALSLSPLSLPLCPRPLPLSSRFSLFLISSLSLSPLRLCLLSVTLSSLFSPSLSPHSTRPSAFSFQRRDELINVNCFVVKTGLSFDYANRCLNF